MMGHAVRAKLMEKAVEPVAVRVVSARTLAGKADRGFRIDIHHGGAYPAGNLGKGIGELYWRNDGERFGIRRHGQNSRGPHAMRNDASNKDTDPQGQGNHQHCPVTANIQRSSHTVIMGALRRVHPSCSHSLKHYTPTFATSYEKCVATAAPRLYANFRVRL